MNISWLGQSGFKIEYKNGDENAVLLVDPYKFKGETTPRSLATDLVLLTSGNENTITFQKEPYTIHLPGEYETAKVSVFGFKNPSKNAPVIFKFTIEEVTFAHLGQIEKTLDNKIADELDGIDVLMIPVGGHTTLSPEKASELITRLEPRIVIPMCFQDDDTGKSFDSIKKFAKEMGIKNSEKETRYRLRKKELPQDAIETIIFKKS